jgi:hypothetical protein
MGGVISYAAGSAQSSYLLGGENKKDAEDDKKEAVDWLNLPCPVKYEEIQREALGEFIDAACSRLIRASLPRLLDSVAFVMHYWVGVLTNPVRIDTSIFC